jgi:hypothetical protein
MRNRSVSSISETLPLGYKDIREKPREPRIPFRFGANVFGTFPESDRPVESPPGVLATRILTATKRVAI